MHGEEDLPYSSAFYWSLQGFSTLHATRVGGLMSVHSFSSTVTVSPDEFILMHSTVRGWTPGPQEVEHYVQAWRKNKTEVLISVVVSFPVRKKSDVMKRWSDEEI